ncbi:DUF1360 domain-containing protein [Streptomyces sp. XH2]|uniref:DUF1360 domain-containing protein n=1 Tax=Streptomyces sp. XH2 TaxID=3412483 RepID=UPI003C7A842B
MQRSQRNGSWWTRVRRSYEQGTDEAGEGRPLLGYTVLLGGYAALTASAVGIAAVRCRNAPARPSAADLALLSVATFRVSRMLAKDSVLSPLRAPFVTYQEPAGPGEVTEAPRPGPVRHAVGELLTCPFCLTQWVATAGVAGLLLWPVTTRWVAGGMTVISAADLLQIGYDALK